MIIKFRGKDIIEYKNLRITVIEFVTFSPFQVFWPALSVLIVNKHEKIHQFSLSVYKYVNDINYHFILSICHFPNCYSMS